MTDAASTPPDAPAASPAQTVRVRRHRRRSSAAKMIGFSPLAAMVPPYATAPALLFVAGLMLRELGDVHWDDLTEAIPAALCTLAMPFTYSIANGLAFGFIAYAVLKLCTGRAREAHAAVWVVAGLFVLRFALA